MWFVYILKCKDGSLYTGVTNDLERRFSAHKNKKGAKYTKSHPVSKQVYSESFPSRSLAQKRESEIKSWKRQAKFALIKK
jgi:putative endonuclease